MKPPATVKWIGLALLGLVIAIGVAVAATNLVSQQIGISSESISAGDALAPVVGSAKGHRSSGEQKHGAAPPTSTETTTSTAPTTTSEPPATAPTEPPEEPQPSEPSDDHAGGHRGGHGADD